MASGAVALGGQQPAKSAHGVAAFGDWLKQQAGDTPEPFRSGGAGTAESTERGAAAKAGPAGDVAQASATVRAAAAGAAKRVSEKPKTNETELGAAAGSGGISGRDGSSENGFPGQGFDGSLGPGTLTGAGSLAAAGMIHAESEANAAEERKSGLAADAGERAKSADGKAAAGPSRREDHRKTNSAVGEKGRVAVSLPVAHAPATPAAPAATVSAVVSAPVAGTVAATMAGAANGRSSQPEISAAAGQNARKSGGVMGGAVPPAAGEAAREAPPAGTQSVADASAEAFAGKAHEVVAVAKLSRGVEGLRKSVPAQQDDAMPAVASHSAEKARFEGPAVDEKAAAMARRSNDSAAAASIEHSQEPVAAHDSSHCGPLLTAAPALHAAMPGSVPQGTGPMTNGLAAHPGAAFDRIDAAPASSVLGSSPRQLSVGVQDSGLGWVEVHAHRAGGQVSAVVAASSVAAHAAIAAHLPDMRNYLAGQQVRVDHLSSQTSSAFQGNGGGFHGNGGGSAREQRQPSGGVVMETSASPAAMPGGAAEAESLSYISVRV